MAPRVPPPVNKEPDPPRPRRPGTTSSPQFTPAMPRWAGQGASTSAAAQSQRQKQQRAAQQERAAAAGRQLAAEQLAEQGAARPANANEQHASMAGSEGASDRESSPHSESHRENGETGESAVEEPGTCHEGKELAEAGEGFLDMDDLARELMPMTGDDGIFEVILPNGKKMGVAVHIQPGSVRFHLSTSDDKFGDRLRQRKMELRTHLERRIHRNVDITVL
jgi:hypothetical protein